MADPSQEDVDRAYRDFTSAVLSEDAPRARDAYEAVRMYVERWTLEPRAFASTTHARRQFFTFNPRTGRLE